MKTNLFILFLLLSQGVAAQDTIKNLDLLKDRVQRAELILEGRIVKQHSFRNAGGMILTSNYIVPLKWFKGSFMDIIELITIGGRIGDDISTGSDLFEVNPGWDYFFFFKKMDRTFLSVGRTTYFPLNPDNGLVIINAKLKGPSQEPHGIAYYDLTNELYRPVAQLVGSDYKVLGKNRRELAFEKQQRNILREKARMDSLNAIDDQLHVLQYQFYGPSRTRDTGCSPHCKSMFQFYIRTENARRNKFEKFTFGEIFFEYDTSVLGPKLVSDGLFNATLGSDFRGKYTVVCADAGPGIIKIVISSTNSDSTGLVILTQKGTTIVRCRISPRDISASYGKLHIRFDEKLMDGESTYYDDTSNSSKPFTSVHGFVNELYYREY